MSSSHYPDRTPRKPPPYNNDSPHHYDSRHSYHHRPRHPPPHMKIEIPPHHSSRYSSKTTNYQRYNKSPHDRSPHARGHYSPSYHKPYYSPRDRYRSPRGEHRSDFRGDHRGGYSRRSPVMTQLTPTRNVQPMFIPSQQNVISPTMQQQLINNQHTNVQHSNTFIDEQDAEVHHKVMKCIVD